MIRRALPLLVGAGTLLAGPSGLAATVPSPPPAVVGGPSQGRATALLEAASSAGRTRSYRATQYVSVWRTDRVASSVADLRHTPVTGTAVTVQPSVGGAGPAAPAGEQAVAATPDLDDRLVRLLADHYQLVLAPRGACTGRPADVLEARRADGSLAGRFWLDVASHLVLRREVYDRAQRLVRSSVLSSLELDPQPPVALGDATPQPGRLTDAELDRLRRDGFGVPQRLPGDLELFDARVRTHEGKQVLHVSYSDGLSTLSLFAQRGRLGQEQREGYARRRMGPAPVWVADGTPQRVVWGGGGLVYTLLSDAPQEAVAAAVAALPHDRPPRTGLLARIGRGLARVGSWLNPFD